MDKAQPLRGLQLGKLEGAGPLSSPAQAIQPQGKLGTHIHSDVRTLIELGQLLGRRNDHAPSQLDDFEISVRKVGGIWEVKFKQGLVFYTEDDTTINPNRIYTEVTGTNSWIAVSTGQKAWVEVNVNDDGQITGAALFTGATPTNTQPHTPKVDGSGGASGLYVYLLAEFTITTTFSYRQHQIGSIEVEFHKFPLTNVGGGSKVIKRWHTDGKLEARTLVAGTGMTVTQGADTITITCTVTGSSGASGSTTGYVYDLNTTSGNVNSFNTRPVGGDQKIEFYRDDYTMDFVGGAVSLDSSTLELTMWIKGGIVYFTDPGGISGTTLEVHSAIIAYP